MLEEWPYSIELYLAIAKSYASLGYPDLAVGAAYKALLLVDALEDDCDEYHEDTYDSLSELISSQDRATRLRMLEKHPDLRADIESKGFGTVIDGESPQPEPEEVMVWVHERYLPMVSVASSIITHSSH